jgi:hypothetical protein
MVARLVSKGKVIVEQIDTTPAPGQIVVALDGDRYRVCPGLPELRHVEIGGGLPAKWMHVVEVEPAKEG